MVTMVVTMVVMVMVVVLVVLVLVVMMAMAFRVVIMMAVVVAVRMVMAKKVPRRNPQEQGPHLLDLGHYRGLAVTFRAEAPMLFPWVRPVGPWRRRQL